MHLYPQLLTRFPPTCVGLRRLSQMKAGVIEEQFAVIITREVLIALAYLQKENVIHRDIKGMLFFSGSSNSPS